MGNVWGINECTVADVGEMGIKKSVWHEVLVLVPAGSPDSSVLFLQHVVVAKLP